MAGHLIAANQINVSVAGNTNPTAGEANPGTFGTKAPTPSEVLPNLIQGAAGHLGAIVAGGSHPENVAPVPVSTQLVKATDSIRGKLGGLIPHNVAPGPNRARVIPGQEVTDLPSQGVTAVQKGVSRVRTLLGL